MKIYREIEQGTYEWHLLRKNFITGTSIKRLLGASTFESEVSNIIGRRLSNEPPAPGFINEKMERGLDLEPVARFEYELETGNKVTEVGFVSKNDFVGLSPDGLVLNDGMPEGAIEIICPDTGNHIHHIRMNISAPAKRYQIADYFYCMETLEWLDFISFDDRIKNQLFIKRILREDVQKDVEKISETVDRAIDVINSWSQN